MTRSPLLALAFGFGTLALAAAVPAHADVRAAPAAHYDARYGHNHYYPAPGYVVRGRPAGAVAVGGGRYWYAGGVWYRPYGAGWVVIAPPVGVFVPVLPTYYTTVWFGGVPYYYADDAYYVYRGDGVGYEVVTPPANATPETPAPAAAPPAAPPAAPAARADIFLYPRNGQSEAQQATDRYECHRWAADQTGFDPTAPSNGTAASPAGADPASYRRAMSACLEGRGYSVK
jgi:hypothetical protein